MDVGPNNSPAARKESSRETVQPRGTVWGDRSHSDSDFLQGWDRHEGIVIDLRDKRGDSKISNVPRWAASRGTGHSQQIVEEMDNFALDSLRLRHHLTRSTLDLENSRPPDLVSDKEMKKYGVFITFSEPPVTRFLFSENLLCEFHTS